MTFSATAPRSRPVHRVANTTLVVIVALVSLLAGLLTIATNTTLEDWRGQGLAACLFKDASGAMQMECRR